MLRLLATYLVLGATAGWAADGDAVAGGQYATGPWAVETRYLCDGDHTATDCNELDLHVGTAGGLPAYLTVDLVTTGGCAGAPTVTVRGLTAPLGAPSVYADLTTAGTSSVRVDPIRHRHIDGVVVGGAGCTDLEAVVRLFYRRVR
ncbi:MAG TPA: hypothetical protein VJA25_04025 [Dehalococcoidia bacterium]|nr:hypothetical protein [Dehalococcoidia bacterium]